MIALAPITSKANLRSPFRLIAPFIQPYAVCSYKILKWVFNEYWLNDFFYQYLKDPVQDTPVFDMDHSIRKFQKFTCEKNFHKASFCRDVLFKIGGANPEHFDLVSKTIKTHNVYY